MQLLIEQADSKVLIEETKGGPKSYFIEGVYLQSELKNRNGRFYPHALLEREVNRYIKESVSKNRAVGELGHPTSPTINYDRASHKILSLKEDGNNWIGRSKILSTPMGNTVKALIDDNVQFGTSSRGMGSLKESDGMNIVQDDYYLATAGDIVSDPSAPDAFVNAMLEHKEFIWNNGVIIEADVAEAEKTIKSAKSAELEQVSLRIFENFISKL